MGASLLTVSALMSPKFMALEDETWNGALPEEPELVVVRTAGGRPCGAASCAQLSAYLRRRPGSGPEHFPWLPVQVVPATLPVAAAILQPGAALTVVTHADGTPAGVLCWADVARHYHEAYRRLDAQFTATLNNLAESVCMVDEDGRVIAWNPAAERLFGIKSSEITGRPLADFFPGRDQYSLRALATGATAHRTLHEPHPDKWVVVNAAPIKLGDRIIGALAVEQDVTSVVRLHEQLDRTTSEYKALEGEISRIRARGDPFERVTGRGHAIQRTVNLARRVAACDATVLIRGESGVGKEVFARAIHDASERRDKPFVEINCGAIPPALFESELFGYERGAFTGADQKGKSGKLEQAQGGTLFLDEVAELPMETQVKLLRVLQDRRFYRLGSDRPRLADVRIIAATNRNLEEMLRQGAFREDLYFRLDVVTLEIPPLRERLDDLADMVHHFAREFAVRHKRPIQGIEPGVMAALMEYSWPGNIRELRNVIERLVVLSDDGMIKAEFLPPTIGRGRPPEQSGSGGTLPAPAVDLPSTAREAQRAAILAALQETGQNRAQAARRLGISRSALYYQMRRLGIS